MREWVNTSTAQRVPVRSGTVDSRSDPFAHGRRLRLPFGQSGDVECRDDLAGGHPPKHVLSRPVAPLEVTACRLRHFEAIATLVRLHQERRLERHESLQHRSELVEHLARVLRAGEHAQALEQAFGLETHLALVRACAIQIDQRLAQLLGGVATLRVRFRDPVGRRSNGARH